MALANGAFEWVGAGDACGVLARADGQVEPLGSDAVAAGEKTDQAYESVVFALSARDNVMLLSGRPEDPRGLVTSVITGG